MEGKIRRFLKGELEKMPNKNKLRFPVLHDTVLVGHPESTSEMFLDKVKAPYLLIQSTDEAEANLLIELLKRMRGWPDLIQGPKLVRFEMAE